MVVSVDIDIRLSRHRLTKALNAAARKGVGDVADRIVEHAKSRVRVKTGTLERSITRYPVEQESGSFTSVFGAFRTTYASAIEWGSGEAGEPLGSTYIGPFGGIASDAIPPGKTAFKKYPIRPKNGEFLRFEVNGRVIFVREVWHPGIRAHPYMRPAVDIVRVVEFLPIMGERIKQELTKTLGIAV